MIWGLSWQIHGQHEGVVCGIGIHQTIFASKFKFYVLLKESPSSRFKLKINVGFWFRFKNYLLGPFIFTIVNFKKRPTIAPSVSYNLGSCPFACVIAIPNAHY